MTREKRIAQIEVLIEKHKPIGKPVRIIFADDPDYGKKIENDEPFESWNGEPPDCIVINFHRPRPGIKPFLEGNGNQ